MISTTFKPYNGKICVSLYILELYALFNYFSSKHITIFYQEKEIILRRLQLVRLLLDGNVVNRG